MIELVRHIEILLLENDCVVVPGFGGFITYYMPASWDNKESLFSPPVRSIGFNPQLRMNDGVLVQSYMETYNTDFSDATKILEQKVNNLISELHREGKVDLVNIGEISLSVHGAYIFSSYEEKTISPSFYGLDSFEIRELKALQQSPVERSLPSVIKTKKTYEIRINRTFVRNAVAAVAAVLLFFYMSSPVENTYVEKANYAQLLPADIFGTIEQQSLLTASIGGAMDTDNAIAQEKVNNRPIAVKEVKVPKNTKSASSQNANIPAISKQYYIIVASVALEDDAQAMTTKLKAKGYPNACVLKEDAKVRVSIGGYATREEADTQLAELRKDNAYKTAWLLIR